MNRFQLAEYVVLRLGHFGALADLLRQLDVVAIVPGEYARQLVAMRQAENLGFALSWHKTKINMIWHARTDDDPGCVWLRSLVLELFQRRLT
jgi:DNA-binding transcriptional LysR family regulator